MQDIKEQIKTLFLSYYQPSGDLASHLSTTKIYNMLRGVIPEQPITEYNIYEAMKEMGFRTVLVVGKKETQIFEGNDDDGTTDEIDNEETNRVFLWEVFEV